MHPIKLITKSTEECKILEAQVKSLMEKYNFLGEGYITAEIVPGRRENSVFTDIKPGENSKIESIILLENKSGFEFNKIGMLYELEQSIVELNNVNNGKITYRIYLSTENKK